MSAMHRRVRRHERLRRGLGRLCVGCPGSSFGVSCRAGIIVNRSLQRLSTPIGGLRGESLCRGLGGCLSDSSGAHMYTMFNLEEANGAAVLLRTVSRVSSRGFLGSTCVGFGAASAVTSVGHSLGGL